MGIFKQSKQIYQMVRCIKDLKQANSPVQEEKAQAYVRNLLSKEGGIFLKVIQYMGTQDSKMEDLAFESQKVIETSVIQSIVDAHFPALEMEVLDEAFSASVGQVNKAKMGDQFIAVKILYPGVKETLAEQLRLFHLIPKLEGISPMKKWGFDFSAYQENIQKLMDHECDFHFEAGNILTWEKYLKDLPAKVPQTKVSWMKEDIYLQEYIEGFTVLEVADNFEAVEKRKLAENLVISVLGLFMRHGVMQGDSNFGNYLFQKENFQVYFIDLGQSLKFSDSFKNGFNLAVNSLIKKQPFNALGLFEMLGFDIEKLKAIHHKLPLLIEILFEPFTGNRPLNLKNWEYKKEIDLLLGEDKWWFRASGGTEFFNFMKGFMGLKNLLNRWNVTLNWTQMIMEQLSALDLTAISIPEPEISKEFKSEYQGQDIEVLVLENKKEKVRVTLPFLSIFNLESYIDEEVKDLILSEGYDIEKITREALEDGGAPKILFDLKKENKEYLIQIK